MKCKKCKKELIKRRDYPGTKLCRACYNHLYIINKWKNNPEYRKKQTARTMKWQKSHPERVREIARGVMRRRAERLKKAKN